MDFNSKPKSLLRQIFFAPLDEVNSDLKDYIGNLLKDSDTKFVLEESLENELDSDDEPSN